jgi:hypothetical protein
LRNIFNKAKVPFEIYQYCNDFLEGDTTLKDDILRVCFTHAWETNWGMEDVNVTEDNGQVEKGVPGEGDSDQSSGKQSDEGSMNLIESGTGAEDSLDLKYGAE